MGCLICWAPLNLLNLGSNLLDLVFMVDKGDLANALKVAIVAVKTLKEEWKKTKTRAAKV